MSLKAIHQNAYRILGVYANAPKKSIVSNESKFNAYLRIKKDIPPLPVDFNNLLPETERSQETISKAKGELSIAQGEIKNRLFWFVEDNDSDKVGLEEITNGNGEEALRKWSIKGTASSLHNSMVYCFIQDKYQEALNIAGKLFSDKFVQWKSMFSFLSDADPDIVTHTLLDTLAEEIPDSLLDIEWDMLPNEWQDYLNQRLVTPILDEIDTALKTFMSKKDDDIIQRYENCKDLLANTKPLLDKLREALPPDDSILHSYADKVCTAVLDICIANYNESFELLKNDKTEELQNGAILCASIINKLPTSDVSPSVKKRIEDNRAIINDSLENMDETMLNYIASNEHICWFCGEESDHLQTLEKTYSFVTESWNTRTTHTKTVPIHVCDKCNHELNEPKHWKILMSVVYFVFLLTPYLILSDALIQKETVFPIILLFIAISVVLGIVSGDAIRKKIDKKNVRKLKRTIDEHPWVKMVKSEGYH